MAKAVALGHAAQWGGARPLAPRACTPFTLTPLKASPLSPSRPGFDAWDRPHFTPCWSGREKLQSPLGPPLWACVLKTSHPWPSTFLE